MRMLANALPHFHFAYALQVSRVIRSKAAAFSRSVEEGKTDDEVASIEPDWHVADAVASDPRREKPLAAAHAFLLRFITARVVW